MAEGTTADLTRKVCPYFIYATCQDGVLCKFLHDASTQYNITANIICSINLNGVCRYGDSCLFSHATLKNNEHSKLINNKQFSAPRYQQEEVLATHSALWINVSKADIYRPNYNVSSQRTSIRLPTYRSGSTTLVNENEFFPRNTGSSADIVEPNVYQVKDEYLKLSMKMCPQFLDGEHSYNETYASMHGELFELYGGNNSMNPIDEAQRKIHIENCIKNMKQDMQLPSSILRSLEKTCDICSNVIMEKSRHTDRPFGILEKCNHVFCLTCIKKSREEHKCPGTRGCPVCGITHNFYIASQYLVDNEEEKAKLFSDFKMTMSQTLCKYIKKGKRPCPYGNACFFLHANPNVAKIEIPPSSR